MKRFLQDPAACKTPGNRVLTDLVYGWGNDSWSALDEYLKSCIDHALTARGPILECGSGLSTILVGAIAKSRGQSHWALEHEAAWASRVQQYLDRYQLNNVILDARPLKDYGDYCWYAPPVEAMPDSFSLVVCDGPPGDTKGGRYGLVPVMRDRLKRGCVILLDDAHREHDLAVARRWGVELGADLNVHGSNKSYVEMTVMDGVR